LTQAEFLRKKRLFRVSIAVLIIAIVVGATIFAYRAAIWPERKLVLYTSVDEQYVSKWAAEFGKATGIKVEYYIDGTQALITRLIAEKRAPVADVLWGGGPDAYIRAKDEGLLVPYTPATIAQIKEFEGTVNMRDRDWYWYPYSYAWFGFAINSAKVPRARNPKPGMTFLIQNGKEKLTSQAP